ncbi:hypothetical protein [Rhizobacter sp. Root1221]|uniref:hypothetical protein n=1 Tax=Rhizobacter sp. Root1221 TaxID=1736433 RepID=UPI000B156C60|nr:hypothetical protein [Rhizobacter sp. Root1221]
MNRGRVTPDSPSGWAWCEVCSDRLQEMEPRLTTADCDVFAATLWANESERGTAPEDAAERFLAPEDEALA